MRAIEIHCTVCNCQIDELCDRTQQPHAMIGRFHRVRVAAAAKVERERNLARRQGV